MGKLKNIRPLIKELDFRIRENNNDIEALMLRGFLYFEPFHDGAAALNMFKRIIELDSSNVDAYYWMAETYARCFGDHQQALSYLQQALLLDPKCAKAHYYVFFLLNTLKQPRAMAGEHLNIVIQLEPTWIFPRISLSFRLLRDGFIVDAEREANAAYELFKKRNFPAPNSPIEQYLERYITGRTLRTQGEFDKLFAAIAEAKRAKS